MPSKIPLSALVILSYLSFQCGNSRSNNNGVTAKSTTSVIASSQMSSSRTIAENIKADSSHSILAEGFQTAGLMETLSQEGPFTVFAPGNAAFRKLPSGTYESLMETRKEDLANILSYHIVAGSIKTKEIRDGEKLRTLTGEELIITIRNGKVLANGVTVITPDVDASNGIIYVIDGVLFPRN